MADAVNVIPTQIVAKSPEKSNTSQKHSPLFHISTALFHNKRLKRKRLKWAALIQNPRKQQKLKTDRTKNKSFNLTADVTINLVSDDESHDNYTFNQHTHSMGSNQNNMEPLYVYTGAPMELSKTPNITLVPVQRILQQQTTVTQKNTKRKRKAQQPKRHCQPKIVNNESIVLSDDEEQANCQQFSSTILPTPAQSTPKIAPITIAQGDEEVTVSLVPRSSVAGSCAKATNNNNDSPFPMLPDETTVHTVISNRIYELSLTKLREGLASCGIPEFSNEQSNISPTQRRKCKANIPTVVTPPQAPISLKLSSDLSISLISDDDEEEQTNQIIQAEKILQHHPQLSVQHLQFPPAAMTVVSRRGNLG